jgi:hypothetical protein
MLTEDELESLRMLRRDIYGTQSDNSIHVGEHGRSDRPAAPY